MNFIYIVIFTCTNNLRSVNRPPLTMSDTQTNCSKCSFQIEVEFGATVAVHLCISNAAACQLKTITIQSSLANTAVYLLQLSLQKQLNMPNHLQLRHPRNHVIFGKIFQSEQIGTLRKIYNEKIHWKPIFFTINKYKVEFEAELQKS